MISVSFTYKINFNVFFIPNHVTYKELGFRDIIFLMLQTAEQHSWALNSVWSPGLRVSPTPHIIPALLWPSFPQLLLLSCQRLLPFWDVWTESALWSWFGFGNCLIRSFTAETRCRGSCSEKKTTNGESARNWKRWQGFGTWYLVLRSDTWWSYLKFLEEGFWKICFK